MADVTGLLQGSNAVSRWFRKLWNTKFVQMAYASWLGQLLTYGVRYDVHDVIKVVHLHMVKIFNQINVLIPSLPPDS